jgi:hypothetical protein
MVEHNKKNNVDNNQTYYLDNFSEKYQVRLGRSVQKRVFHHYPNFSIKNGYLKFHFTCPKNVIMPWIIRN